MNDSEVALAGMSLPSFPARPLVGEVVAMPGLIVDGRDDAGRASAELILRGGIGVASSGEGFDVHGFGI